MYGETNGKAQETGGLNVFIYCANVQVRIDNITIQGNMGYHGGNLALYLVVFSTNTSTIVINQSRIVDGIATKGGGLRFWSTQNRNREECDKYLRHPYVNISNTLFRNNSVTQTGGAVYVAYYSNSTRRSSCDSALWQLNISKCTFNANGGNGAAMEIIQHSLSHHRMIPLFQTSIENCLFTNNFMPPTVDGPILDFKLVEVSVSNCTFTGSNTTVISLRNTYLNLYGQLLFENNTARVGGALKICEASLVYSHIGTNISFVNNRAQKGGAIYVQQPCMDTSPVCFIQPAVPKNMPVKIFTELMNFTFINNSAMIAGDALYGGDLDLCTTVVPYHQNTSTDPKHYWYSKEIFDAVFNVKAQTGPSWISSDPRGVCFCLGSKQNDNNRSCITRRDPIEVHPGERFSIAVITVGQMYGSTSGIINSILMNEDHKSHSFLQLSHPESSSKCINLTYVLNTNRSSAQINFRPVTTEIATHYKETVVNLTIQLLPCPLGFQLTNTPPYQCTCNQLITDFLVPNSQVTCNITSQVISLPQRRMWFGCKEQNRSSICDHLVVTPNCDYYCRSSENNHDAIINISISDFDGQCVPGHTGIMCGACKPGYSRVLGGALVCQKGCTNANLSLILVFLVSGVALIAFIRALNLTVTEGTLNGVLVYTMIIQTHYSYFSVDQNSFGKLCWMFISWINLTIGIETCFFEGMDGYQQVWILYSQIFYFLLIISLIILLSRRFIFFTKLFGRNIVKILATVILLLYSNLLFATYTALRYATLHISTSNGTKYSKVAWYYDGNIPYMGLKHAPLLLVALVCLIFMFFYVFSLLLVQCLQKKSDIWCLRWVERLRPFYEAYTGPCCDNYRFWPGFLLFMRTGLYIMNSLIPRAYNDVFFQVKMLITASIFITIMSLACIFPHGVYKQWPLNVLEFSFYLNLSITSLILGFNYNKQRNIGLLYTSVSVSILTIFGIFLYHIYSQIKGTAGWKRFAIWFSIKSRLAHIRRKQMESKKADSDDEKSSLLPQALPPVYMFDDVREPLLEA